MGVRADMAMVCTALVNGWDIPPDAMARALETATKVMDDPSASTRDKIRAAELINSFVKTNVSIVALDLQAKKIEASKPDMALTVVDAMKECDRAEQAMNRGANDASETV